MYFETFLNSAFSWIIETGLVIDSQTQPNSVTACTAGKGIIIVNNCVYTTIAFAPNYTALKKGMLRPV